MIPKIIHQSQKDEDSITKEESLYRERLLKINPNFEYKFWSDEDNYNLIKDHYNWFLPTYDSYKWPVQKADACRYFYLHRYGGIYLDLDMEAVQPIARMINFLDKGVIQPLDRSGAGAKSVFLFEEYPNAFFLQKTIFNGIMVSSKGDPFWPFVHFCLQAYQFQQEKKLKANPHVNPKTQNVLRSTGPRFLREAYIKYKNATENLATGNGVNVFPWFCVNLPRVPSIDKENPWVVYDSFHPKNLSKVDNDNPASAAWSRFLPFTVKAEDHPNTFFIHQSLQTWHKDL